jgi:hypothetical protein
MADDRRRLAVPPISDHASPRHTAAEDCQAFGVSLSPRPWKHLALTAPCLLRDGDKTLRRRRQPVGRFDGRWQATAGCSADHRPRQPTTHGGGGLSDVWSRAFATAATRCSVDGVSPLSLRRSMTDDGWVFRRPSATPAHDARRRKARGGGRRWPGRIGCPLAEVCIHPWLWGFTRSTAAAFGVLHRRLPWLSGFPRPGSRRRRTLE